MTEKYAPQMATQQRSRAAILAGAKSVIVESGNYESNMIEIAARAQVSRATVYNHFADKEEMMLTLLESEIDRLAELARSASDPAEALRLVSVDISADPALRKMVTSDPLDIARFVTVTDHPLWARAFDQVADIFGEKNSGLVIRWLIGQIGAPLTAEESAAQALQLASALTR